MMGFGLLPLLVLAGVVAYAAGWRPQFGRQTAGDTGRSAGDILRERYARGEISKAEYEQMRDELRA